MHKSAITPISVQPREPLEISNSKEDRTQCGIGGAFSQAYNISKARLKRWQKRWRRVEPPQYPTGPPHPPPSHNHTPNCHPRHSPPPTVITQFDLGEYYFLASKSLLRATSLASFFGLLNLRPGQGEFFSSLILLTQCIMPMCNIVCE